ncbi:MAG: hypothetical protein J6A89_01820 [Clostridia bacterium]|nr:hypothetical protein [Clostridia bacterium]
MGQRSQIYIRYNNGETLVAKHLQWNWGTYMISRAYQLLKYIEKNAEARYSNFFSENFEITNMESRSDLKILDSLSSLNLEIGSYVENIDLIEENYLYRFQEDNGTNFKFNPEIEDNNDGILVIDINENEPKIKVGFSDGYRKHFEMCSAKDYLESYKEQVDYILDQCTTEKERKEVLDDWNKYVKMAEYIDKNFVFLTQEEYEGIFDKEYCYEKCISEERMKLLEPKRQQIIENDERVKREELLKDWKWLDFDDCSGCFYSPSGKSYFCYDSMTREYKISSNENWKNMPERFLENFDEFIEYAEKYVVNNLLENQNEECEEIES